jgi:hypothetical protein
MTTASLSGFHAKPPVGAEYHPNARWNELRDLNQHLYLPNDRYIVISIRSFRGPEKTFTVLKVVQFDKTRG